MKRILLTIATASIFATGCGALSAPQAPTVPSPATVEAPANAASNEAAATDAPSTPEADGARVPGDFVVYRFSGSFRKTPLTLTERVIAREGGVLTIDLLAQERDQKRELRIKIDETVAGRHDIVAVFKL